MPGPRAALALLVAAVATLASCAGGAQPRHPAARAPATVSVGQPLAPRPVAVPGPGTIELGAPSPTRDRRPTCARCG